MSRDRDRSQTKLVDSRSHGNERTGNSCPLQRCHPHSNKPRSSGWGEMAVESLMTTCGFPPCVGMTARQKLLDVDIARAGLNFEKIPAGAYLAAIVIPAERALHGDGPIRGNLAGVRVRVQIEGRARRHGDGHAA